MHQRRVDLEPFHPYVVHTFIQFTIFLHPRPQIPPEDQWEQLTQAVAQRAAESVLE